jgi:hypothetical protein
MLLTYRYRLLPTKRQHATLADICEAQRLLYNAALRQNLLIKAEGADEAEVWRELDRQATALNVVIACR